MCIETEWADFIAGLNAKESCITHACPEKECRLKNGLQITLRRERRDDYRAVEFLTREAFWNAERIKKPGDIGADEHYLAHTLRTAPEFVPELDYIAEYDGKIIGNVLYSLAYVILPDGRKKTVLNFGPLSVLPEFQNQGVGSALMRHTLKTAARLGYGSVLFFGHASYYPRFGFKEAKSFGITTSWGENYPAFMAMELIYGDLDGVTGAFYESPLFNVDGAKAKAFDAEFPATPAYKNITVESERLSLRPLDARGLSMLLSNPDIIDRDWNLTVRHNRDNELDSHLRAANASRLRQVLHHGDKYEWYTHWMVIEKSERIIVGGIMIISEPNEKGEVEFGYGTDAPFQNRGYMTEAVGALAKWAFKNPEVKYVTAETEKENGASHKVLIKNGFERYKETEEGYWWRKQR